MSAARRASLGFALPASGEEEPCVGRTNRVVWSRQVVSFVHLLAVGGTTNALLAFVIARSRRYTAATVVDDVII
jgi:hypothetical protein